MQIAGSGGAAVVWVGMPPMQNPGLSAQMSDLNAVVQHQAAKAHPPVTYLSTDKSLGTAQGGLHRLHHQRRRARSSTCARPTART